MKSTARLNIGSVTMPAGEYYVGDPCYSVPDDRWMEWLEAADYMKERRYLVAEIDGLSVLGVGTAYGDGVYPGSDGFKYGVDAGLIGLVPVTLKGSGEQNLHSLVSRVTFGVDFECSYDDGVIQLGHIRIDTN